MKALILCAGEGRRSGLKKTPKCMVKINKKPVLEHLVDHLNKHGITEIIVNIHKNYEKIFKYFGTRLLYLYEPTLLGTAGTEKLLQNWLGDEYIVMNGDTLTNLNITDLISKKITTEFYIFTEFFKERYGGTKYINKFSLEKDQSYKWDGDGAYYFDCGTPEKLRKARRFYAKKSHSLP